MEGREQERWVETDLISNAMSASTNLRISPSGWRAMQSRGKAIT